VQDHSQLKNKYSREEQKFILNMSPLTCPESMGTLLEQQCKKQATLKQKLEVNSIADEK